MEGSGPTRVGVTLALAVSAALGWVSSAGAAAACVSIVDAGEQSPCCAAKKTARVTGPAGDCCRDSVLADQTDIVRPATGDDVGQAPCIARYGADMLAPRDALRPDASRFDVNGLGRGPPQPFPTATTVLLV